MVNGYYQLNTNNKTKQYAIKEFFKLLDQEENDFLFGLCSLSSKVYQFKKNNQIII